MRRKTNARYRVYDRLTLRQLCKIAGITPHERIVIARYFNREKGGEKNICH
jgi:hypothetical protein